MEEKHYAEPRKIATHGMEEGLLRVLTQRQVYIAGPLYSSGRVTLNVKRAIAAALVLRHLGEIPIIPHLFHFADMIEPHPPDFWLQWDFDLLRRCDVMLRLPGYSEGSDMEEEVAKQHHIPVFFGLDSYVEWLRPAVKLDRATCELFDITFVPHPQEILKKEHPLDLLARVEKLEGFAHQVSSQVGGHWDAKAEAAFARGATRTMPEGLRLSHGHPGVAYEALKSIADQEREDRAAGKPPRVRNMEDGPEPRTWFATTTSIAPPLSAIARSEGDALTHEERNPEPQNSQDHASLSRARTRELLRRFEEETHSCELLLGRTQYELERGGVVYWVFSHHGVLSVTGQLHAHYERT